LESILVPTPPRILAALVWQGAVRKLLIGAVSAPASEGMTITNLPPGCVIFESNPRQEAALLYLGTDGKPHCQRVLNVCEDIIVGRTPSWDAPMSEWPGIFARQQIRVEGESGETNTLRHY
jgi:hypothetical protein